MIRCSSEINHPIANLSRESLPKIPRSNSAMIFHSNFSNSRLTHRAISNTNNPIDSKTISHDLFQCPINESPKNIEFIPNIFVAVIISNQTTKLFGIPITYSVKDLSEKASKYFDISLDAFELLFDENLGIIDKSIRFSDIPSVTANSTIQCLMSIHDMDIMVNFELIKIVKTDSNTVTDGTVFVHVRHVDSGATHTVRADIERLHFTKHFLGGVRHRASGLEYHHAVTQTRPVARDVATLERFSRDTQTHRVKNRSIDNVVPTATQMTKPGCFVSNVADRVVTPGPYQTADERLACLVEKVVVLQKNFRRWLARRRVARLRAIRQAILDHELGERARKEAELAKRLQTLLDKHRHPLYNDDFDLLYNAIEKWRLKQVAQIDPRLPESGRKAMLCQIMDEQHEWLLAVDRLKNSAIKLLNFRAKKNKLVKVSKPVVWKDRFGESIEMDLMTTTRGKEVYEIYKSLSMDFFNAEERLDILLTLKRLIANRPEKICADLLSLINREADLIMRNVGMHLLKGLRTRINTTFLILCRLPSFNPGVEKYLKVPKDPLELRGTFQLCRYCNSYLKNSQFMFSVKSNRLGACRACTRLFNHAMPRLELSPYRHALLQLQKAEEEYQDNAKMAFIFSEIDIKHLITKIWDSKSILSSSDDLEKLIFIRWSKQTEWSPWNTALMTIDESEAHYKLDEPCSAYSEKLLDKIHQKQIAGHNYFLQLKELSTRFTVHNLKEEQEKIEMEKLAEREKFIQEKSVRFQ